MPIWKPNLIPFGFARSMWVLAEDQALERPPIASPAAAPAPAVSIRPTQTPADTEIVAPGRKPGALQRIATAVFDALMRYGERSYENKRRSGRLNHYFY
jgi:hypothetical protein